MQELACLVLVYIYRGSVVGVASRLATVIYVAMVMQFYILFATHHRTQVSKFDNSTIKPITFIFEI